MNKHIVEFIGTFFLVYVIGLTGGNYLAPIAIGSILMVMVYFCGHISGAIFNPAVGLALWIRGKINMKEWLAFSVTQVVAAFCAAVAYHYMYGKDFGGPRPDLTINIMKPLFVEVAFTFALASVVLAVSTSPKTAGNSYYGIAIGFTVCAAAFAGGGISGGAFNPAVGTGPILMDQLLGECRCNPIQFLWLYWVAPLVGGALAGFAYRIINPEEFKS